MTQKLTFVDCDPRAVKATVAGQSYSFKPDGSATPTPFGNNVAWTKIDDNTWKAVYTKDSTVLDTDTWKLAADGNTAEISSTGTKTQRGFLLRIRSLCAGYAGYGFVCEVPAGLTLSATRISSRKFALLEKINGKVLFKGTNEVSADGKMMTSVGSPAGVSEATIAVYQKQ